MPPLVPAQETLTANTTTPNRVFITLRILSLQKVARSEYERVAAPPAVLRPWKDRPLDRGRDTCAEPSVGRDLDQHAGDGTVRADVDLDLT